MKHEPDYYSIFPPAESIVEVRLCDDIWKKVRLVAHLRRVSYSWVVRYATFRLIRRKNPAGYIGYAGNPRFCPTFRDYDYVKLNEAAWRRRAGSDEKHRHRLCLYGSDELYLRLTAALLGCTMTHLVRLALEKYLDSMVPRVRRRVRLGARAVERAFWFWLGIKLHEAVEFPNTSPIYRNFSFKKYPKYKY